MGYPSVGTRFGPYELRSVIGIGGMGEVYRAYDTRRERMVALKVLRTDVAADPSFQARFRRESRIAARLQEPHVIPVHDYGDIGGVLFIDMRLVEGPSLRELVRVNGVLPLARAAAIIAQIAAALDAAHAVGLVHRDIKPENVLLTHDDFAYLVDFGIAYGGGEATVTKTGLVIGSCAYMSPERLNGTPGGPASDVYSLTCLLFECLTGRAPFEADDIRQVMSAHMFAPPPRPSAEGHGIGPAFDDVIARGMAKNPADRFGTAGELARAAAAALHGPPARQTPPPTRQLQAAAPHPYVPQPPAAPAGKARFGRSQTGLLLAAIGTLAVAAGLAAAIVFTGGDGSPSQRPLTVPPSSSAPPSTTTTSATALAGVSGADAQGFVGHAARCEAGDALVAAIRTASSLAVICDGSSGGYYYHGERLRDGANVRLANAVPADGGFDAVNPADGARYEVRPDTLTILSNGRVDSAERALEYGSR
ncbi:serine/threonine-protein kinase [Mycolicibacterium frederiksbergense]|uniref:non-specific serine/threonine protein kinase n=1 Tax=Mycolicibacterium frederiksbergense TaxID=117567 RepID=A0A6H0S1F4_9MYCO|nr:serine/threonine-protein kinase [Mycolicibacterium frederiksbergense]QIV81198.1 serine/threonine protein kinase [Mycolicibacterium frederiksbergense]